LPLTIASLAALEILDSRGRPTIAVSATLSDGTTARAHAPSGASTGRHEALELRDGDPSRYGGKGVRRAAANVEVPIANAIRGMAAADLPALDRTLIALDGTANKSKLGANAILGVSCAVARALSQSRREPLWRTLADAYRPQWVPLPMINILSGGLHAEYAVDIQDFLLMPHGFDTYSEALHATVQVHGAAREVIASRGLAVHGVADEGGWGPRMPGNEDGLRILTEAIERAGYRPGEQCSIALDVASSHFFSDGFYQLASDRQARGPESMVDLLERWTHEYPVVSIEDGLDQDDWEGWPLLTQRLGDRQQLIGDDFFTTNPDRVRRGIASQAANAVLVKMNQIGTLAETFEVLTLAAEAGWRAVVSARSGETEDSFLADLASASGAGQIKVGSITRSERLAKYNRLLELEREGELPFARFAIPSH
jgi:enolase